MMSTSDYVQLGTLIVGIIGVVSAPLGVFLSANTAQKIADVRIHALTNRVAAAEAKDNAVSHELAQLRESIVRLETIIGERLPARGDR